MRLSFLPFVLCLLAASMYSSRWASQGVLESSTNTEAASLSSSMDRRVSKNIQNNSVLASWARGYSRVNSHGAIRLVYGAAGSRVSSETIVVSAPAALLGDFDNVLFSFGCQKPTALLNSDFVCG